MPNHTNDVDDDKDNELTVDDLPDRLDVGVVAADTSIVVNNVNNNITSTNSVSVSGSLHHSLCSHSSSPSASSDPTYLGSSSILALGIFTTVAAVIVGVVVGAWRKSGGPDGPSR